jgi:two-component system sensor histidine kinase KdpD
VIVSGAVELAARRGRVAQHASRQAETLSALAGGELDETDSLHAILQRARGTFGMESVALKARTGDDWRVVDEAGWAPAGEEASLRFDVPAGRRLRLVGRGPAVFAQDQRVLRAFAAAAQTAYDGLRLGERAREASALEEADQQHTALLAAVGHDLRTPLAAIKASASTLRQTDVEFSADEQAELLATVEESADRLDSIVTNLLDASRLQAGALGVQARPVALDEVIGTAVLAVPGAAERVTLDVPEDLPLVHADPGLLERVIANLLENAIRHGAPDKPVEVSGVAGGATATLKIVDHGPGVPSDRHEAMFQPFQHADDRGTGRGLGLGLSIARGFTEAMGGVLIADSSSGTGLTMRLRLPLAQ